MRRFALLASIALIATTAASAPPRHARPAAATAHNEIGVDVAGIDRSVAPGDSFDRYANGAWRAHATMPADRTRIGSFINLGDVIDQRNRAIVADALSGHPAAGTDQRRIADYYTAYLDMAGIDARGTTPLQPLLAEINAIQDRRALSTALGATLRADVDPFNATNFFTENLFGLFVSQGLQTPDTTIPYLLQGGLGMPDRDYYLSDAPDMVRIRTAYRAYIADMLGLMGVPDAQARAARIFDLEMKIARAQVGAVDAQDPAKMETWSRADFARRAPGIDWDAYFAAAQLGSQQQFMAGHPGPIAGLSALVGSEPLDVWKDWLAFHTASQMASVLPRAYDDLRFGFYGRTLSGQQQQRPRDRRALASTSGALG
ncbi:MAG: M13 family peptidase, partial [Sphingomonadaceae bacterium]|nr:M13 family peptidase [Sphingomonadaceae bacterium]